VRPIVAVTATGRVVTWLVSWVSGITPPARRPAKQETCRLLPT
jgi:hypothetical protein